jgi:arylsulfatase A-like enzyme
VGKTHFFAPRADQFVQTPDGPILDLRQFENYIRSFGFDYVHEEFDRYVHAFPQANLITHYSEYLKAKGLLESYQKQIRSIWRLTPNHWDGVTSVLPQEDDLTCYIADRAVDWLEKYDGDKPFFLMVSFVQPHVPLMDDPIWAEYYREVEIPLGPRRPPRNPGGVWGRYLDDSLFKHSNSHLLSDEYVTNGARHYYGMVSLIDQRIGDIMRIVDARGWGENTWFLYSADHGEMLGDHNLMAKMNFYKGSVLVPAIVRPPQPMKGKVVDSIVESIDLTATILDVAGVDPLERSQARSLIPFLEGYGQPKEAAFSAISSGRNQEQYFVMVANERYRLTIERNTGQFCELFDLEEDPDELHNLVDNSAYRNIREKMKKDLLEPYLAL